MTFPVPVSAPLTIGRFRVQGTLSCGTSHILYQAIDTHTGTSVAVKCGLPGVEHRNSEPFLKGEWEAAQRLTHPGIQRVLEMAHEEGIGTYLVLESLEGKSLASLITQGIPTFQGLHLLVQLAHVLEASERDGLLHGDLRPENLWISPKGTLRVLGFGSRNESKSNARPEAGVSASYLDPERLRGAPLSPDSELFAFAVTAYQILTKQLPYGIPSQADGFIHFPAAMPKAMQWVFSKALDKQPENHYTDLHGFISVLIAASPLDEEHLESLLAFMDGAPVPIDVTGLFQAEATAPNRPLSPRDTQPIPIQLPAEKVDPELATHVDSYEAPSKAQESTALGGFSKARTRLEGFLSDQPNLLEFAIYTQVDTVGMTSHPGGAVASLAPSYYFQMADSIHDSESKAQVKSITIKRQQQGSLVLAQHAPFYIALLLKPGKSPKGILDELQAMRSK